MSKPIEHFQERGEIMLKKWGEEMTQGSSNILANLDNVRETNISPGGWPPAGSGMSSPLAAEASIILRELSKVDAKATEYLTAHAFGLNLTDMVRVMGLRNRAQANIEFKEAKAMWSMAVYYRSRSAKQFIQRLSKEGLTLER